MLRFPFNIRARVPNFPLCTCSPWLFSLRGFFQTLKLQCFASILPQGNPGLQFNVPRRPSNLRKPADSKPFHWIFRNFQESPWILMNPYESLWLAMGPHKVAIEFSEFSLQIQSLSLKISKIPENLPSASKNSKIHKKQSLKPSKP